MGNIIYKIKGMHCLSCAIALESALENLSFIKSVRADFAKGTCEIEYEGELPKRKLENAVKAAGFKIDD